MKNDKYVAYVSTYTSGMADNIHGIKIYDVDIENGRFQNIRYKCKYCGHDVSINTKDVKEIKSI